MYLQNVAITTEDGRHRHKHLKYSVPTAGHQITAPILLVTSLLLLLQLQTASAPPTTGITTNDPTTRASTTSTTVKTSSDDTSSYSGHYFTDIPPAASTILITLFAALFSYGLSIFIKVFCPDQCDHMGNCAQKNSTVFCKRHKRTIAPLSNDGENEAKPYPTQPPMPIIGIPNGRPDHKKNVQKWLEQVDHTIGVPNEATKGTTGNREVDPDNIASTTYDNEINQVVNTKRLCIDTETVDKKRLSINSDIIGNCANKERYQLFVVVPATNVTNNQITDKQELETNKTKINISEKKRTADIKQGNAIEKPIANHTQTIKAEINGYTPTKEKTPIRPTSKGVTSQPKEKREVRHCANGEVRQKAWNDDRPIESWKGGSSDSSGVKESEPLLRSPSQSNSPLSTPTSITAQRRPLGITIESLNTEVTSTEEESPRKDEQRHSFVSIEEAVHLKPPTVDVCPESKMSSMHNIERREKEEETKDDSLENKGNASNDGGSKLF